MRCAHHVFDRIPQPKTDTGECLDNQKRTHIAERVSFVAREFRVDGKYSGNCVFKNIVNVLTDENQAADNLQDVRCVRCIAILGSKFDTVCYWDGHNSLPAEAGLPAMLAEAGQGEADPLQDPGHEAQVQADAEPDNQGDDDMDAPGAWYFG
ncbi:hypothetical protein ACLB2K_030921 [Fragaria x ananassa]